MAWTASAASHPAGLAPLRAGDPACAHCAVEDRQGPFRLTLHQVVPARPPVALGHARLGPGPRVGFLTGNRGAASFPNAFP